MRAIPLVFSVLVASCAASGDGEPPAAAPAPATASAPAAVRRVAPTGIALVPLAPRLAEDGAGGRVAAERPVAIDVTAESWPGRARDPVLEVGPLRFREYEFPAPGVIRFVAADRGLLPAGAEVAVQWGDDAASRVVVTRSLAVQP